MGRPLPEGASLVSGWGPVTTAVTTGGASSPPRPRHRHVARLQRLSGGMGVVCALEQVRVGAERDRAHCARRQGTNFTRASATSVITGLTPGSNTFTAKYRITGGTGTWRDREIVVVPLT